HGGLVALGASECLNSSTASSHIEGTAFPLRLGHPLCGGRSEFAWGAAASRASWPAGCTARRTAARLVRYACRYAKKCSTGRHVRALRCGAHHTARAGAHTCRTVRHEFGALVTQPGGAAT